MKKKFLPLFIIMFIIFISCGGSSSNNSIEESNSSTEENQQPIGEYKLSDGTLVQVKTLEGELDTSISITEIDPTSILGKEIREVKDFQVLFPSIKINLTNNNQSLAKFSNETLYIDNNTISEITIIFPRNLSSDEKKRFLVYRLVDNSLIPAPFEFLSDNSIVIFLDKGKITEKGELLLFIYNNYIISPDEVNVETLSSDFEDINSTSSSLRSQLFFADKIYPTGLAFFEIPVKTNNKIIIYVPGFKLDLNKYMEYSCGENQSQKEYPSRYENNVPVFEIQAPSSPGFCNIEIYGLIGTIPYNVLLSSFTIPIDKDLDVYQYTDLIYKYAPIVEFGKLDRNFLPLETLNWLVEDHYGCYLEELYKPIALENTNIFVYGKDINLKSVCFAEHNFSENEAATLFVKIGGNKYWTKLKYLYRFPDSEYAINSMVANGIFIDYYNWDYSKYIFPSNTEIYATAYEEGNKLYLQYWFYYMYDPKTPKKLLSKLVSQHAGDLERITVVLEKTNDGDYKPLYVFFAHHNDTQKFGYIDVYKKPEKYDENYIAFKWNEKGFGSEEGLGGAIVDWNKIHKVGTHPIVYVALGSHGIYPRRGIYIVDDPTFDIYGDFDDDLVEFAGGGERIDYTDKIVIVPRLTKITEDSEQSFLYYSGKTAQTGPILDLIQGVKFMSQNETFIFPYKKDGCKASNQVNEFCSDVDISNNLFPNNDIFEDITFDINGGVVNLYGVLKPKKTADLYFSPDSGFKLYVKWDENSTYELVEEFTKEQIHTEEPLNFSMTYEYLNDGDFTIFLKFETPEGAFVETAKTITVQIYTGGVTGSVKDAVTLEPIEGVEVNLIRDNVIVASTFTDHEGNYTLNNVPIGTYTIKFSKDGYVPATGTIEIIANTIYNFPTLLYINEEYGGLGKLEGFIRHAITGQPISDVQIVVFKGIENTIGDPIIETTSNSEGYYILELEAGYYTVVLSKEGFKTSHYYVSIVGNTSKSQDFTLSPLPTNNEIYIILTWGEYPPDLDAHLVKIKNEQIEYHVAYFDMAPTDEAFLDRDDTTSFGPETITIRNLDPEAIYRYYVHDYTTYSGEDSMALANSGATVRVIWGENEYVFNVPNLPGTAWKVFEIVNGVLVPCQENCVFGVEGPYDSKLGLLFINGELSDKEILYGLPLKK